ncbi:hypothetical protein Rsub_12705 [Raphidocelis subcapitata]|uniref:Uncharacterized protein n=1 Tax=Raphidocelis subcapitata TaxID=307507 RepID=A0A2V0PKZ4_9CHLO|nr:hypothetical protein Rsub_12705 [Raphidocelis subcapitata]|eukprot:GBG00220.1 hypothetical protein Rsub_12705 [Raphidocelis subcapitata]
MISSRLLARLLAAQRQAAIGVGHGHWSAAATAALHAASAARPAPASGGACGSGAGTTGAAAAALLAAAGFAAAAVPVAAADASRPAPASGAPAALDERGLTNNPLDYDPITNEHTAAMTLARKQAMEAYDAGRYDEAEARFKAALAEARKGFPPEDLHIPSALNMLAEFYRNTRRFGEAAALYQEAIDHLAEATGEKHWMYASALANLALCREEAGDLPGAAALLERALALRRAMFGPASVPYADTAFALGRVLRAIGGGGGGGGAADGAAAPARSGWLGGGRAAAPSQQEKRWLALMGDAVKVLEESGDPAGSPIIEWELAYADALRAAGRAADAVPQLRAALAHLAAAKGDGPAHASEVAERLVDALQAAGQLPAARAEMQRCVETRMQLFGRHLVVAKSMTRLAHLLLERPSDAGDAALAQNFASSAAALAEEAAQGRGGGGGAGGGGAGGGLRGLLSGLFGGGAGAGGAAAERLAERLRAQLELGAALQALAAANEAASAPGGGSGGGLAAGVEALRRAVEVLRTAAREGAGELAKLAPKAAPDEAQAAALTKAAGLLVDARLAQMEALEALADALAARQGGAGSEEARALLAEAEAVAHELSAP